MIATGNSGKIPAIFCVDVEPDPRLVNRYEPEPWKGYEFVQRYFSDLRPLLEEQTGNPVRYCWFFRMDPQIAESYGNAAFAIDRYPDFTKEIESHGDEIGLHLHTYRWSEKQNNWLHDFSKEWVEHCIRLSFENFEKALGRKCKSFRFGDGWLNLGAIKLIEQLGIRFDLTVEPGRKPWRVWQPGYPDRHLLPSFYRAPREPYIPSETDFLKHASNGSRKIFMIPLTSSYQVGTPFHDRLLSFVRNGIRYRHQDTPLGMWRNWQAPNNFEALIDRSLAAQQRPYLACAVRSDVGIRRKLYPRFDASVQAIVRHPAHSRFLFCTPEDALRMLGYTLSN